MNRPVYEIDGASFYELVTGERNALQNLFHATVNILSSDDDKMPQNVVKYCRDIYTDNMPA